MNRILDTSPPKMHPLPLSFFLPAFYRDLDNQNSIREASPMFRKTAVFLFSFAFVVAAFGQSKPERKPPTPSNKPLTLQEPLGEFWTLQPGWHSEVELRNNFSDRDLIVTPVIRAASGAEFELSAITIPAHQTVSLDLLDALKGQAAHLVNTPDSYGQILFRHMGTARSLVFSSNDSPAGKAD